MPRANSAMLKGSKDFNLLKLLQSAIKEQLSAKPFTDVNDAPRGFVLDWNSPKTKDIVFRRKCKNGEEIAVSALLDELTCVRDRRVPSTALMKVVVKKPGLSSILQYDCKVVRSPSNPYSSDWHVINANYFESSSNVGSSLYTAPLFSSLDPKLQHALRGYLEARGIEERFTDYLLQCLDKKYISQNLNWLTEIEAMLLRASE